MNLAQLVLQQSGAQGDVGLAYEALLGHPSGLCAARTELGVAGEC